MEFDVLAVLSLLEGEDLESRAEQLLNGFMRAHPETGPVASVDLFRGTFDIAFTVEAPDAYEAIDMAKQAFSEGAATAEIPPRPLEGLHVDHVTHDREAVPA
jgi:hypothetical protein